MPVVYFRLSHVFNGYNQTSLIEIVGIDVFQRDFVINFEFTENPKYYMESLKMR